MKIAIFSDSHDNVPNLNKFFDWVNKNKIQKVIFCGDLCAPVMLREIIMPKYKGDLYMVFGNVADRINLAKIVSEYDNVTHFGDQGEVEIDAVKIGFVHYPDQAEEMAKSGQFDFVFHGHTHKPWVNAISSCQVANPGTLAGLFNKATFAVLDTKTGKLDLKLVEKL